MPGSLCPSCGVKNLEGADECANCGGDLRTLDVPKPESRIEQSVMSLPLTTLSLTPARAIGPDAPLSEAVRMLAEEKVDLLEVVEAGGQLLGVLSVRDIVTRAGADYQAKLARPVRQFMTSKVETLPPDAPITYAINRMDVGGYRHVPVVQDGHVLGVVSSRDVIQYLVDKVNIQ